MQQHALFCRVPQVSGGESLEYLLFLLLNFLYDYYYINITYAILDFKILHLKDMK